jgi:hypothetical protein
MSGRIAYYGNIVRDGLVLCLDTAKKDSYPGTGTTWRDIAGGVITGSLVNGPTFDSANAGSIVFDGIDDNVNIGNIIYNSSSATTIDIWVNIQSFAVNDAIITKGAQGAGIDTTFATWMQSNQTIRNRFYNSSNTASFVTTPVLSTNTWYNLSWTYDGSFITLYQDGTLIQSSSLSGTLKNCTHPILIGSSIFGNSANIKCSTLKIYNESLSQSEILQNYNATKGRYL